MGDRDLVGRQCRWPAVEKVGRTNFLPREAQEFLDLPLFLGSLDEHWIITPERKAGPSKFALQFDHQYVGQLRDRPWIIDPAVNNRGRERFHEAVTTCSRAEVQLDHRGFVGAASEPDREHVAHQRLIGGFGEQCQGRMEILPVGLAERLVGIEIV